MASNHVSHITAGGLNNATIAHSLYGYCTTAAGTAAKTVTMYSTGSTAGAAWAAADLIHGLTITVRFQYSNTASSPTLNVNSTGAKPIYKYGTTAPGTSVALSWPAQGVVQLTYDTLLNTSGCWVMNDHSDDTTISHSHGNITNAGDITAAAPTIATSDKIIINDESASKITNGPAFDTSDSGTFLCHNGTWATPAGGGTTAADYIVEQGTSGDWAYRKYNSGVAECWRQWTQSATFNDHTGNGWYSSGFYATFPSGLFTATPLYCNISGIPSSAGFSIEYGAGLSSTRTQTVWLLRVEGGTSSAETVGLCAHAMGTWK